MHLFGLTGGIASGKSVVARRFRERGVPVIDADALAREVVAVGSTGLEQVVAAFGRAVLQADGSLDRKKVAAIVFADPDKRRVLNGIVHPLVTMMTFKEAARLRDEGEELACYEAPLIVENGAADTFRPLVVVSAPEATQVERAVVRDGATADEVRARIAAQKPLAEKIAVADFVIENDGSLADLERRADEVLAAVRAKVER